ncbi:RES family NAD+ phosphorylase [Lonsdalea quercina]|uniref:RES family NAD+ phosphorylase n=1 Tax=Lonsdalea quercina TaxID=71657 RepID=UPI003976EE02
MGKEKNNDGDSIYEKLTQLEAMGRMPFDLREANILPRRWQWQEFPSGVHYRIPTDPENMGRYNDPSGRTGICYTADFAIGAIAESLGRVYQQDPKDFVFDLKDLKTAQMYTLKTTRPTKIIDMTRLQGVLHLTSDQTMGEDTSITQAIVDWAANTPGLDYDGISYRSRHYGVGWCTAFWEREGASSPLTDVSHCSVNSYVDSDPANFPPNWTEEDISGFDIVTETLQFSVSQGN